MPKKTKKPRKKPKGYKSRRLTKRGHYAPCGELNLLLDVFEDMLDLVHQRFLRKIQAFEEAQGETVSCTRGCTACCKQQVLATVAEGLVIARYLLKLYPKEKLMSLLSVLEFQAKFQDKVSAVDWFDSNNMCGFVDEKTHDCTIYKYRPAMCRFHCVISPAEDCAKDSGHTVATPDTTEAEAHVLKSSVAFMRAAGQGGVMAPGTLPTVTLMGLSILQDNSFDILKQFKPSSYADMVAMFNKK